MDTQHDEAFMFQGMPRGAGGVPPGVPMQQQPPQQMMPPEASAREKLIAYIYEYLVSTGASKTAETYKEEVLATNQNIMLGKPCEKQSSFLLEWWMLFWDLYSAAPERREHESFSADAKYFHESGFAGMPPGMMNGHGMMGPPMGMGMMGPPEVFGARFGPPGGRMPPGAMPPGPPFGMFDPRMPRIPGNAMRMPPPGPQFPGPPGGMRPGVPGGPMGEMPVMPRYDFMGPGQPFAAPSGSGMMPNGGMPHMSLNSPNMGPPPGPDPNMPGAFMGMQPNPASTSTMSFGMGDQPMSSGPPVGNPGTPGMGSVPVGASGPGSVPQTATTSVGSVGTPGQPKTEPTTANGEEMKTEALTPTGAAGGSVGAAVTMNGGGPGSAPGSAHSVNNNVNPTTPGGGPMSNPMSNPLSNPPLSSGPAPGSSDAFKDDSEISKIREGLLDGFKTEMATWGE